MKKLLFLLVIAAYTVRAVPMQQSPLNPYSRFIKFPDGDDVMHIVDLEAEPDVVLLDEVARNPADNIYLLFTRRNPQNAQTLVMDEADSIRNSNFNANLPTVIIAHGWLSNQNADLNPVITDACLRKSDVNVIVLDWSRLATSNYVTAVNGVPAVGRGLGMFLAFVNQVTGAPFSNMHLVGFSLGAHVVGNAGRELNGRAARITGLDPAGPLWHLNHDRLNENDAVYVEGIHTDGGMIIGGLGIGTNVGNADFYPNGGVSQPGCFTNICNHNLAWRLFAATIIYNNFIGCEINSSDRFPTHNCSGNWLLMGNIDLDKFGSGVFRVTTRANYPFL